jgi:hypothetical protein
MFETCRKQFFFLSETHLEDSLMDSSLEVHLNFDLAKMITTTESKSVSLGLCGFETWR